MAKRKTLQINEDIHARFGQLWKKIDRLSYSDSASGILEFLIDFYERHNTPEMRAALELVKISDTLAAKKYGQIDIMDAISQKQKDE